MKLYFDTSVLVAFAVRGHTQHAAAYTAVETMVDGNHDAYASSHGLAEFYAVLTRTPFRPPVYPTEVWQILEESILPYFTLVTLTGKDYQNVLRESSIRGWTGGRIYDMLHLRCAQKERCERIYTLNVRHFRDLAPAGLAERVCVP